MSRKKTVGSFRKLLFNGRLDLILEAHNGLSARIVEETGYPAIWASGLAISSAMGLRDCNASIKYALDQLQITCSDDEVQQLLQLVREVSMIKSSAITLTDAAMLCSTTKKGRQHGV